MAIVIETSGDQFAPDDVVTREQFAEMLYRYAKQNGQGFTGAWMFLLDYSDASGISESADEAMHWMAMHAPSASILHLISKSSKCWHLRKEGERCQQIEEHLKRQAAGTYGRSSGFVLCLQRAQSLFGTIRLSSSRINCCLTL